MSTNKMGGISTVDGGEKVTTGEEIDKGDGVGKVELLDGRVCSESHSSACLIRMKRGEVHPEVTTLEDKVAVDDRQEVSYSRNPVKINSGSSLSCPPTPEHFHPASS